MSVDFLENNSKISKLLIFLIILYPLLFIWQGLDFTDMGYWLTNYNLIFKDPNSVIQGFSCYLSEIIGGIWLVAFSFLGVIGIKIAYVIVLYLTMYIVYLILRDFYQINIVLFSLLLSLIFIIQKSGLCGNWIGYNNLTSLFYVLSVYLLYKLIRDNNSIYGFLGGFIIALNIFIRFPNILGMILPVFVIYYYLVKKKNFKFIINKVLFIIFGWMIGVLFVLIFMYIFNHFNIYLTAMKEIFGIALSSSKNTHSGSSLIKLFISDHINTFKIAIIHLVIALLALISSTIFYKIQSLKFKYLLGILLGIFVYRYSPIIELIIKNHIIISKYEFTGILYILLIFLFVMKRESIESLFIVLMAGVVLILTPLGSGNGIWNSVFGMWLAFSLVVSSLLQLKNIKIKKFIVNEHSFLIFKIFLIVVVMLYSVFSKLHYTYRDSYDRTEMKYTVNHIKLRGVFTKKSRAKVVQEVLDILPKYINSGDKLLAVESVGMLYYLTDTKPYMHSSWPFLNSPSQFKYYLDMSEKNNKKLPVIVYSKSQPRSFYWPDDVDKGLPNYLPDIENRKILSQFMIKHHYKKVWENMFFEIYIIK